MHLRASFTLSSHILFLQATLDQMHDGRCKRQDANDPEYWQQVMVNIRNRVAQPIAEGRDADDPEEAPENVIQKKRAILHAGCSSDHGSEGPDKMHKPGEKDGFPAVALIKVARVLQLVRGKKPGVLAGKQLGTHALTKGIAD